MALSDSLEDPVQLLRLDTLRGEGAAGIAAIQNVIKFHILGYVLFRGSEDNNPEALSVCAIEDQDIGGSEENGFQGNAVEDDSGPGVRGVNVQEECADDQAGGQEGHSGKRQVYFAGEAAKWEAEAFCGEPHGEAVVKGFEKCHGDKDGPERESFAQHEDG